MISALAAVGTFRLGGTVVGTTAFRLYEGEPGVGYGSAQIAQTNDIDIDITRFERLSLALDDKAGTALSDTVRDFDFAPVPSVQKASVWRWTQTRSQTQIEFLTPSFRAEKDIRPLPAPGVAAQSLPYLNDLREALAEARANGPRWGRRIDAGLLRMPATAALLAGL